ncbi:lamin tail domain-containing protein [Patescibacteria group bacterium]|nr:lamin tail domain-containing protein [Patescibacteria group bacterium]
MKRTIFISAILLLALTARLAQAVDFEQIPEECRQYFEPEKEPPIILINEVSFRDDPDWIEFYVLNDKNGGNGVSVKDFSVHDDKEIKKFPNTTVKTGDFFTLTLNSASSDTNFEFFADRAGLTGTTEQVVLRSNYGKILDAVCWSNSSPPQSELDDFAELQNEWTSDIQSCVPSGNINKGESIGRTDFDDTNSANDWEIFIHPTKTMENIKINNPPVAIITIQSGDQIQEEILKINLTGEDSYDPDNDPITFGWDFGDGEASDKENPTTKTYDQTGKYEILLEVEDTFGAKSRNTIQVEVTVKETEEEEEEEEDLILEYPEMIINEFMPNPDGTDTGNEWIELKNPNIEDIDLTDWQLDDTDGGSKPFLIENKIIAGNGYMVIESGESKINLNNTEDTVRLFDPNGKLISEIPYESAPSGQSLARNNDDTWYWTGSPTKGTANIEIIPDESEFQDGDISDELEITEIFPNPEGTDTGNEWIEIHNNSDTDINMGNWQLDDAEGGSKPFTFSDSTTIHKQNYLVISSKESKLNLGNKKDEIRLFDPENSLVDTIEYESAPNNMSYAKLYFTHSDRLLASLNPVSDIEEKWEWTNEVTLGKANPEYEIFEMEVLETENIRQNSFTAKHGGKEILIKFDGNTLDPKIAYASIKVGTILEIEAKNLSNNTYQLKTLKIKSFAPEEKESNSTSIPKIIAALILLTGIALTSAYFYKQYRAKGFARPLQKSYTD